MIRRSLQYFLFFSGFIMLGGCVIGNVPEIVPADLVIDPAYEGTFINKLNKKRLTIRQLSAGRYDVVLDERHTKAIVLATPQRKLLILQDENDAYEIHFFELQINGKDLQVTPLNLDLKNPQVQQSMRQHHVEQSTTLGKHAVLKGLRTTTAIRDLFSDPQFNRGVSLESIPVKGLLSFYLLREP